MAPWFNHMISIQAVLLMLLKSVIGIDISSEWAAYTYVTDSGILDEICDLNEIRDKEAVEKDVKIAVSLLSTH